MASSPKVEKPKPAPSMPTRASFISRGGTETASGRPLMKFTGTNPATGSSAKRTGRPSLLGGS